MALTLVGGLTTIPLALNVIGKEGHDYERDQASGIGRRSKSDSKATVSEKCGHCTGESLRTVNRTEFWDAGCHANSISIKRNTASLLVRFSAALLRQRQLICA